MKVVSLMGVVAAALLATGEVGSAQPAGDPVISAYREYTAAMDHHDPAASEAAAAGALTASEARDGGGKMTAVLALNLASIMMDRNEKAQAIAPARRAYELAHAGARGIDELMARLLLGEAELSANPKGDESFLISALAAADQRTDLDDYAYPAALVLKEAALTTQNWKAMQIAGLAAQHHLGGQGDAKTLALVQAMKTQAIGLIGQHEDEKADPVLMKALRLILPLAPESADADTISDGEILYSEVAVLRAGEEARRQSEGLFAPPERQYRLPPLFQRPQLPRVLPLCQVKVSAWPMPTYPPSMLTRGGVGAVGLRLVVTHQGVVSSAKVLAVFPEGEFRQSVQSPAVRWRVTDLNAGKQPCEMASNDVFQIVKFSFAPPPR